MLRTPHGVVDQVWRDELILTRLWKVPIDFHTRLIGVLTILIDDLLIDGLVGTFDRAGIDLFGLPEFALTALHGLVEIPGVAPTIGERKPVSVRDVFSKEARCNGPDGVRYPTGFVENHHHAVHVVRSGVGVRVLLAPQLALSSPVPGAFLQVAFDQFSQPVCRIQTRSRRLPPVRVDRHRDPLGQLTPSHFAQLTLAVGRHDH